MGKTALFILAALPLLAQQPARTNADTHFEMAALSGGDLATLMANLINQGGQQMAEGLRAGTAANQRQQLIDLERHRFEWEKELQRQSARLQDRVLDRNFGYRDAKPEVADWRINQDVLDAFAVARKAHPDFDALQPVMRTVADSVRPDWSRVSMQQYVECLYAIAKTADFAEPVRQKLLADPQKAK